MDREEEASKDRLVRVNLDGADADTMQDALSAMSALSGLPVHSGHIEHGYSLRFVSTAAECPRCHAPTQQAYANFIYATQMKPRVASAPAGYFCTKCPTVVIDEELVHAAMTQGFRFQGVLGLDSSDGPNTFKTWNGKEPIYVFDEDQIPLGLATDQAAAFALAGAPPAPSAFVSRRSRKASARRRMKKETRRKNRRKKK
jgi:hypothetical protein